MNLTLFGFAAISGLASSFGPCLAARFLTVAGLSGISRVLALCSLMLGTFVGIALLAFSLEAFVRLTSWSWMLNETVGIIAIAIGLRTLLEHQCESKCCRTDGRSATGIGVGFLLGILSTPCCSPLVLPLVFQARGQSPTDGTLSIAIFVIAQSSPLLAAQLFLKRIGRHFSSDSLKYAIQTTSGTLWLALGALSMVTA